MIDALKPALVFVVALSIFVWVGIGLARRAFQFERKGETLAPLQVFFWRIAISVGLALVLVLATLSVGMVVYYYLTPTHRLAIAFIEPHAIEGRSRILCYAHQTPACLVPNFYCANFGPLPPRRKRHNRSSL